MARYYAVRVGRVPGVYKTWEEANAQVNGYSGAEHRAFPSLTAAVDWAQIPINLLASWVQDSSSTSLLQHGPPPPYLSGATPSGNSFGAPRATPPSQSNSQIESLVGRLTLSEGQPQASLDRNSVSHSSLGPTNGVVPITDLTTTNRGTDQSPSAEGSRLSSLSVRNSPFLPSPPLATLGGLPISPSRPPPSEIPLSSTPHRHPAVSNLESRDNRTDYSVWSSTDHSHWIEDSILSNVYHPPAAGPTTLDVTSTDDSGTNEAVSDAGESRGTETEPDNYDFDPMVPSSEGLMGVADENTWNYRVHLRAASMTVTQYTYGLQLVLGRHAINYLHMHYYSAGSVVAIANAYMDYNHDGESFIRVLLDRGMPPRHAAFLWTIIRPEVYLGRSTLAPYQQGTFYPEDDEDMSFTRRA
ncbi:hypothetical protein FRC01_006643 [Tulasnella sp. 417]|nr:hypothetical protein FRC01_006643 [Tulasnella sp. 417]